MNTWVLRFVVIYDMGPPPSRHNAASSVTVTAFIWLTFKVWLLQIGRELVTFISAPRQSVSLNDNSRAHIVRVEAFDYPCGCPRKKANCCSALLSTFLVPSRALVSRSSHLNNRRLLCDSQCRHSPPLFLTLYNAQHLAKRKMDRIEVS